jgi:ribokinase
MQAFLADVGIDTAAIQRLKGHATGTAMIAVDEAGENQIIVNSGANMALSLGRSAPAHVCLAQLEIPLAAIAGAFANGNALRILNAAPFVPEAAVLFAETDILIVNQHEMAAYAALGSGQTPAAMIAAARRLLTRDDQTVIVTLGADGAVAITRSADDAIAGVPVSARDTVGAGDCFCGTLAGELAKGVPLADAMKAANAAAALCTLSSGAIPAMPASSAVAALLADLADWG